MDVSMGMLIGQFLGLALSGFVIVVAIRFLLAATRLIHRRVERLAQEADRTAADTIRQARPD